MNNSASDQTAPAKGLDLSHCPPDSTVIETPEAEWSRDRKPDDLSVMRPGVRGGWNSARRLRSAVGWRRDARRAARSYWILWLRQKPHTATLGCTFNCAEAKFRQTRRAEWLSLIRG